MPPPLKPLSLYTPSYIPISAPIIISILEFYLSSLNSSRQGIWGVFDYRNRTKTGYKMDCTKMFLAFSTLVLLCCTSAYAQAIGSPPTLAPAPAPGPEHVNLTQLLSVAGPFSTFLGYLESTKVIETFQNQANNTEEGITIFVPKDKAFSSLKTPSLSNLTAEQLKSLCLFHALSHYYSLSDFKNLSGTTVTTLAGGSYTLNLTDISGTILIGSGWTNTKVSSSVRATDPLAVYQVDKVLLPEAIFGTDIPPMPAPAPAPDIAPSADAPSAADVGKGSASASSSHSSSCRIVISNVWSYLILAIMGGFMLLS